MKILFLNYEYPPLGGGAGVATEAILKEWAQNPRLEVHVVTAALGTAVEHIHIGGDTYVHRVPIGKKPGRLHSQSLRDIVVYTWKAALFLRKFLRAEQKRRPFDATLAFFTVPCGFLAALIRVVYGIPYAVSLRGADVPGFSEKYARFYYLLVPCVRVLWRFAGVVIPCSQGLAELARRLDTRITIEIIENGVDTTLFVPAAQEHPQTPLVFLSTSRLTARKGLSYLIRAFAQATQAVKTPMELQFISDGEERPALEALARELGVASHVTFFGRIEHDQLPRYYQHAHVFVLPSKNEGMSNSALEALASGLPLLVSRTGGMQEIVGDGINGFFVDPEDTDGFAEKITRLADSPELRNSFAVASRERALSKSWSIAAHAYERELQKITKPCNPLKHETVA